MRKPSAPVFRMKYDLPSRTNAALSIDVVSSSGSPSAKRSSGRGATLSVCPPDDSKRIAVPTRRWMSRSGPLVSASSALLCACSPAMSVSVAAARGRPGGRLAEPLLSRDRDPLRQHRQRAARLLVLRQRLPLALEYRERRRMERVAGLEASLQELARLGLGRGRIHRGPLRRELRAPLEAPVAVGLGDVLPDLLASQVLEEPPPDDLADLGLVVGDQVLGDAPHHLRDPVLPLLIRLRHLDLASRQADPRRAR